MHGPDDRQVDPERQDGLTEAPLADVLAKEAQNEAETGPFCALQDLVTKQI